MCAFDHSLGTEPVIFCIWFPEIRGCIMLEELDELKQKKYKPAKVHLTCAWFLYLTLQIKLYPSWLEMIGWKEQTCISVSPSYLRIRHLEPREVSIQLQWEYQRLSQKIWCLTIKWEAFEVSLFKYGTWLSNNIQVTWNAALQERTAVHFKYTPWHCWRVISLGNWKENSLTLLPNNSFLCQTRDKCNFAFLPMCYCVCVGIFKLNKKKKKS